MKKIKEKSFFGELDAAFSELRKNPKELAEHEAEQRLWDNTLLDGLEENQS